nr:hypothetical protein [Nesterenkonia sp.]
MLAGYSPGGGQVNQADLLLFEFFELFADQLLALDAVVLVLFDSFAEFVAEGVDELVLQLH